MTQANTAAVTQQGPLTAQELEAWVKAEEAMDQSARPPLGDSSHAQTRVEAYRSVCGPRLLAQFLALESRLARLTGAVAEEMRHLRRQRDELASYVVDLRRWLVDATASLPPGLSASADEIRRFEEHINALTTIRR